jgi:hypothetical protein
MERLDFRIRTLIYFSYKNTTSPCLCQAKISLRPASHQHCTTKRDFRISGPTPHGGVPGRAWDVSALTA